MLGSWTVSRLRPFLRRRLRTARPQRVAMRVRNPCFRIRRVFRGRYVGLPIQTPRNRDFDQNTADRRGKLNGLGTTVNATSRTGDLQGPARARQTTPAAMLDTPPIRCLLAPVVPTETSPRPGPTVGSKCQRHGAKSRIIQRPLPSSPVSRIWYALCDYTVIQ